jgi:hypothetical protein
MHEEGRARSDERGDFRFDTPSDLRYLIVVRHQNVSYHTETINGTLRIEVPVYDAAPALQRVREDSDTLFFEVSPGLLTVSEFFVLFNASDPPRTLTGSNTFEFAIPPWAILGDVAVQPPETLPLLTMSWRCQKEGHYRIAYPIRPGTTTVRIRYRLPYSGVASLAPTVLSPVAAMALMIPGTLRLTSQQGNVFQPGGEEDGLSVYMAKDLKPGRVFPLTLTGNGELTSARKKGEKTASSPSAAEASTPEVLHPIPSKQTFVVVTNSTSARYYEIPIVLIAFLIVVGMIRSGHKVLGTTNDSATGSANRRRIVRIHRDF